MSSEPSLECVFYVPERRDSNLSDGAFHNTEAWEWLDEELYSRFDGYTLAPELHPGCYRDPDTKERVNDKSYRFTVAIPFEKLDQLRELLAMACVVFGQKCIYLSVAGQVEFVRAVDHETNGSVH